MVRRSLLVLSLVALLAAACSVDSPEPAVVDSDHTASAKTSLKGGKRSIEVNTTTAGADPGPHGYMVTLNGGSVHAIGINGTVTYQVSAPGITRWRSRGWRATAR